MLSIIDIIEDTTVDGPGFRTAIYAAGCPNACPGCHNPESWDIKKGKQISTEEILTKVLADDFANVTFSGGEFLGGDVSLKMKYVSEFNAKRRFESDVVSVNLTIAY